MAGENDEMVAGATNSSLTPPTGLTRREMREWERQNGIGSAPVDDAPIHTAPPSPAQSNPAPVAATQVAVSSDSTSALTRRELRLQSSSVNIIENSFPEVLAPVAEDTNIAEQPTIVESAPVVHEQVSEASSIPEEAAVVEPAPEVMATDVIEDTAVAEPVVQRMTIAQVAAASQPVSEETSTRPHTLIKRGVVRRPAFLSNRSKRDRSAADRRRQISQRVVSVLALVACFAFALSISIPANALLTQQDVAQMKMQSFLDEQVSLASQSMDVDSDAGTTTASRDGVDVTLAAKAAPIKFYGNSGLCGEETDVNPPATSGHIGWPLANTKISSGYGYRWGSLHAGIDFEGETGTPIYAAADGIVKAAMPSPNNSLGICAIISHNVNGVRFDTLYGHMSRMDIGVGQSVTAGQTIGAVGSTGNSTGSHLHFEVHVNGVQIDPGPFMSNYAG